MPQLNFNPSDHPADEGHGDFPPLPAGWYNVVIEKSALKATKQQNGEYIEFELKVLDGQGYNGRMIWDRLTIKHPNETTVGIANRQLGDICRALRITALQATEQLHGKPLRAKLKIKQDDTYGPRNEVAAYAAAEGGISMPPPAQASQSELMSPPAGRSAPGGGARPPWAR